MWLCRLRPSSKDSLAPCTAWCGSVGSSFKSSFRGLYQISSGFLLLIVIYAFGILCRNIMGNMENRDFEDRIDNEMYFGTLPRAMLTLKAQAKRRREHRCKQIAWMYTLDVQMDILLNLH